jgi:hypothetical protein
LAILVIGGGAKDVGKTALVCAVIAALREFNWTAVKITGHDYPPVNPLAGAAASSNRTIREETVAGSQTDTARYLAAGARRALLVTRHGPDVPIEEIRRALGNDPNVIFESNRIIDALRPDVCLALVNDRMTNVKASFDRLLRVADALVSVGGVGDTPGASVKIPRFSLQSPSRIPPEMLDWLRRRLIAAAKPGQG